MPTIVCPQCGNDNSIQRVSAVVAGGTSTGSFSGPSGAITYSDGKVGSAGGYTTLSGGSSTNLAKMLAMSPIPQSRLIIIPALLLILGIYLVGTGISIHDTEGCLTGPGIIMLIISIVWIMSNISHNKDINIIEKPNWDLYKTRWDQLYYCHKHGIVFDPSTSKTCEPAQIKDFVYELIKDQIIKPETSGTGVQLENHRMHQTSP